MSTNYECRDCQSYEERGHNYCRMCGAEFKKGMIKNVRIADGYHTGEKFCGYCGGRKHACSCC